MVEDTTTVTLDGTDYDITDTLEEQRDAARAEGFMAGLFMGSTLAFAEGLSTNDTDTRLDSEDAIKYLRENNDFEGAVITANDDVDNELYVFAPHTEVENADTPEGWYAVEKARGGIGFNRNPTEVGREMPDPNEFESAAGDIEDRFPEADFDPDIDAAEIMRELEGVETAHEAVDWIHANEGSTHPAHVSTMGPDEQNPYVVLEVEELPLGWTRYDGGDYTSAYLVKE